KVNMTVANQALTLFSPSDTPSILSDADNAQVNLGMRFTSSMAGTISGIRYYKSADDTGTHTGSLWTSTGTLLATATFTNDTASGWQTVTLSSLVSITTGTTYVVSFRGHSYYSSTPNYFSSPKTNGPLTAPSGNNGVYAYGSGNVFPNSSFENTNYWVDVMFHPAAPTPNEAPVAQNDSGFSTVQNTALQISASALLANDTDPNGDPLTITGVSGATNGTVSFDAQTNTITFTPANNYTGAAGFTYAISDGRGGTASATVALNVTQPPPNQPPVAANDSGFSTVQNTALQISASALLANDTDPNGDPLTITGVSGATNGTVSFDPQTNTITFVPANGYSGVAGFTYEVSDGRGGTASANVALNVTQNLFGNATPGTITVNDSNPVELGVKFTASSSGTIYGVRFY